MKINKKICLIALFFLFSACSQRTSILQTSIQDNSATAEILTLTVMTHDSFAISQELIATFQDENQVIVKFIEAGDTGTAVNKAALSKNAPLADVFYGVDNTFLSRALNEDIFEPYSSPLLAYIPEEFIMDLQHRALPVDFGDVCLN